MYIIIEFIFNLSGKKVLDSNKENIAAEGGLINDEILKKAKHGHAKISKKDQEHAKNKAIIKSVSSMNKI